MRKVADAYMLWWDHQDGWSRAACQQFGWHVRRTHNPSSSCCTTPETGFNVSHWKKARAPTPKFRPIFHPLAVVYFLSHSFPPRSLQLGRHGPIAEGLCHQGLVWGSHLSLGPLFYTLYLVLEIFTKTPRLGLETRWSITIYWSRSSGAETSMGTSAGFLLLSTVYHTQLSTESYKAY